MLLAANAEPVLNISKAVDEEALLLIGHSPLNDHEVYILEYGFEGYSHLFQGGAYFLEPHFHAIIEENIQDVVKKLRAWITCEIIDGLGLNHPAIILHGQ